MKNVNIILSLIFFVLICSCTNSIDNEYFILSKKIEEYKITSRYKTPLFDYFTRLDSLTTELVSEKAQINSKTFTLFKSLVVTNSINDSIKEIVIDNLNFNFKTSDEREVIDRVKIVRNIYLSSIVNFYEQIENDSSFNDLIKHTYYTTHNDTDYLNLDLYIPTADRSSLAIVLRTECQWSDIDLGGLTLRVPDKPGVDTISVEIKWFDDKLKNTIKKNIIILGQ